MTLSTAKSKQLIHLNASPAEIRQMMHGFGDSSKPLLESARIIEEVVLQQMRTVVKRACEIAERRATSKKNIVNGEDILFLLRKNKIKLQRLLRYLGKRTLIWNNN